MNKKLIVVLFFASVFLGGVHMAQALSLAPAHWNQCYSEGRWFNGGYTTSCIDNGNGLTRDMQCIADAHYICRNGSWEIEPENMVYPGLSCSQYDASSCPVSRCKVEKYGGVNWMAIRCVDKVVTISNNKPVINSFTGPTSLQINETGTWRVSAYDKDGDTLTYDIDWGDRFEYAQVRSLSVSDTYTPSQRTTFEHTYSQAGTYTVRITVRDSHSNTVTSTITVWVKNRIQPPVQQIDDACASWTDGCNTCSREYIGGPSRCTQMYCIQNTGAQCYAYFNTWQPPIPEPDPWWYEDPIDYYYPQPTYYDWGYYDQPQGWNNYWQNDYYSTDWFGDLNWY